MKQFVFSPSSKFPVQFYLKHYNEARELVGINKPIFVERVVKKEDCGERKNDLNDNTFF